MENINTLTLEAWVKRLGPGSSAFPVIVAKSGLSEDYQLAYVNSSSSLLFRHEFLNSQGQWQVAMPSENEWNHIALTFDVSETNLPQFYLNGMPYNDGFITSTAPSGLPKYGVGPVTIGSRNLGIRPFYGHIDEVRIWNTIRTPQEIQENYNKTIKPNVEGLVGYWSFEEGSGIATADYTSNSNGTLVGDVLFSTDKAPI